MLVQSAQKVQAQRTTSMRINEALVINEDNYVDDYGRRGGWVELYNTSANVVNIAGCFLTDDINEPKKYPIPKGDVLTKISPRQHILFWADSMAWHGTFHLNFRFQPDKSNFIALFDSDGKTLIDSVTVPAGQIPDVSYGLEVDGGLKWTSFAKVTPSTNNLTLDKNEKIENFKQNDAKGIGMTLTAMGVVFLGLILLYLIFKFVANMAIHLTKLRSKRAAGDASTDSGDISGEVLAAISTALYELNEDVHDIERTVLTIQKVRRTYSPWSSKIYSLREIPRK
ncbi:MAG: lamin tail domain-containing protein [Tannerellaceae bacterium]|nr:lamin tail domain-containing protein [Tannerellaceae bacterium]